MHAMWFRVYGCGFREGLGFMGRIMMEVQGIRMVYRKKCRYPSGDGILN